MSDIPEEEGPSTSDLWGTPEADAGGWPYPQEEQMSEPQTVWVLEPTDYDQYGIVGVFDSPEAAMAVYPKADWVKDADGGWTAARQHYYVYPETVKTLETVVPRA